MTDRAKVVCGYCDREAKRVGADKIYKNRPDLLGRWFWKCDPCDAYVGCHPGTDRPLGVLSNKRLRHAKQRVHRALDPLWKSGAMKRKEAYAMLAKALNISAPNCHIGMFDYETCVKAWTLLEKMKQGAEA